MSVQDLLVMRVERVTRSLKALNLYAYLPYLLSVWKKNVQKRPSDKLLKEQRGKWFTLVIPEGWGPRQEDCCEFKTSQAEL